MSRYKHVILIDDDEDDCEIFLTALERIGNPVQCSAYDSAKAVLEGLLDGSLRTDLIFLDLNMPVMNGQQFLVEIKKHEQLKHIPVIIFSTTSHAPTIQVMKELGAASFISKPEEFPVLVATLKATFDQLISNVGTNTQG